MAHSVVMSASNASSLLLLYCLVLVPATLGSVHICQQSATPQYCKQHSSPYHLNSGLSGSPGIDCHNDEEAHLCADLRQSCDPYLRMLDEKICIYAATHMLTAKEAEVRQKVLNDLSRSSGISFQNFTAFSSSCTGFGLREDSDLDVYIVANGGIEELSEEIPRRVNESSVFQVLHGSTTTKYYLKLLHVPSRVEVDLNIFDQRLNSASQVDSSTALFRSYAHMDSRVKILGVFLKILVRKSKLRVPKHVDLNSSACLLLLIHYLQRTEPPLLPVLGQEPHYRLNGPRNNASVGELWLGFLHYYVHEFEWEDHVVSIRHRRYVTKDEKGWRGHGLISIEHPINTVKDSGLSLELQMAQYVLTVFNRFQKTYITDFYDSLINHNRVYLDDHPRYRWKGSALIQERQHRF